MCIRDRIIYLASGEYSNIDQLARENYKNNQDLQRLYRTEYDFIQHIPLKGKLSGVIDLATATGKSYVIYGIAQIMLSLGLITKVLVLCPSLTIESGLMGKFKEKTSDARLKASIPETTFFKNPRIIDANSTIKDGDICVENIHAVYDGTGSSIIDSLKGRGEKTLVLSDEVHHVYNSSGENDIRKWKTFLMSEDFQFKYLLGFTGTAYIENEYFPDVIYRFSLREAMERSFVKLVEYVAEDESGDPYEKFQKIYDNHKEFQKKYGDIKPLTIMVTKDIKSAGYLYEDFLDFIEKKEGIRRDEFEDKVLVVTSAPKHKKNVIALKTVDDKSNPAEWVVSVSMLTEGWDVKNVFQIVPWEDRAFNSKLLIAQVLGRGLRIPEEYKSPQPKVRVFNHDAWSRNIRGLVDEILEIEVRLTSKVLTEDNANRIFKAFQTLFRARGSTIVLKRTVNEPKLISTKKLEKESIAVGAIKRGSTVFYTENFKNECSNGMLDILQDIIDDESLPRSASKEVNPYCFKTPVNVVLTKLEPERKFVEAIVGSKVCAKIDAWIKSRDMGFYSVEYSWRKGEHPTQGSFNPDLFLKLGENIVVIEIKSDGDDSEENKAKYRWAKKHFEDLNEELKKSKINQRYFLHFLSPNSYAEFVEYFCDNRVFDKKFRSKLEDLLDRDQGVKYS